MRVPPIPRSLLPHSMAVRPCKETDDGRKIGDEREIGHVRYVKAEVLSQRRHVLLEGSKGIVYVDRVNSDGAFAVPVYSEAFIGGERLTVVKATPYEEFDGTLHHWELEVA